MEKREQVNIAIGIALLFAIITSIFSIIKSFITWTFLPNGGFKNGVNVFIRYNILYIIVVILIICLLIVYIKKTNQKGNIDVLENENTRLITGILVSLQGIMDLSSVLPIYFKTLPPLLKFPQSAEKSIEVLSRRIIIVDVISVALILCQIFVGVYLAKCYKKKIN